MPYYNPDLKSSLLPTFDQVKNYVREFEENLEKELIQLHKELTTFTYEPRPLKRCIIRDPKTRTIHA